MSLSLTHASAAVKRGVFFCIAKNMTLFTVSWMRLLGIVLLGLISHSPNDPFSEPI
jgi:hypothetical protein